MNLDPAPTLALRTVVPADIPILFEQQRDPVAVHMAAFTTKDPDDEAVYRAWFDRILADPTVTVRAILAEGALAGSVLCYGDGEQTEVSYWLGREFWGRGLATQALAVFIDALPTRPLHARVAKDNVASLRVLQKNGFAIVGEDLGFANARGADLEEWLLRLS